jgi:LacI family transcriptional regulator, galactose operon repressor
MKGPEATHPSGKFMKDPARHTLKSMAEELGLSVCTISRTLNGKGRQYRIAKKTEQRILQHARELGFSPNLVARGLRLKKTHAVGLILPDLSNPFFAKIARSLAEEAHGRKYTLEVCDSQDNTEIEIDALQHLQNRHVDGMVLCPVGKEADHLRALAQTRQPVVLVDRYFPDLNLPYVTSDNVAGSEAATRHLLAHGHRKIACLQGLPETVTNIQRLEGYRRALGDLHGPSDSDLVVGDGFTRQSGYVSMHHLQATGMDFTAILAFSNQIALGALQALNELELKVPEDVSLVSFDDIDGVEFFATPLTTVSQQGREIGQTAANILFEWIDQHGKDFNQHLLLPTQLISRCSVGRIEEGADEFKRNRTNSRRPARIFHEPSAARPKQVFDL